jgi:uncharacterized protein YdaU (DUF1376 family)
MAEIKERLRDYLLIDDDTITQERLQRDYKSAMNKSKTNAENGRKGGQKTAENWKSNQANAVAKDGGGGGARRRTNGQPQHISAPLEKLELELKPEP